MISDHADAGPRDTDIFYEEIGPHDAPVLVALHGGLGLDHAYLRPHWDKLAERSRLVYMDARGNGRSGRPALQTITMGNSPTTSRLYDDTSVSRRSD